MSQGRNLPKLSSLALLITGLIAIAVSFLNSSTTLALIGLGLTFWGFLFLYVRKEDYIQEALLEKTTSPSLMNVNQIIINLGFDGQAIYLPPKYLKDPESSKIIIAKNEKTELKTLKQAQESETMFVKKPESILITPPGADLARLFEKKLGISFIKVDLKYIARNFPNLLINDLEIAENVKIDIKEKEVTTSIANSIYMELHTQTERLPKVIQSIGCPICSAIACAITKATGSPIMITNHKTTEDGETIVTEYNLL
jgi:hypothetical protein